MKNTFKNIMKHPIIRRYFRRTDMSLKIFGRWTRKNILKPLKSTIIFFSAKSIVRITAFLVVMCALVFACVFFQVGDRYDRSSYIINIPKGYSANQVAELLQSRGIISGKYGFNIIIDLLRLQNRMQAGTYSLSPNDSLLHVINKIIKGEIIPPMLEKLVFPEGLSIYKMGLFMEKEGVGDGIAFQDLTRNAFTSSMLVKYDFLGEVPTDSLEGYLFPDTYLVPSNIGTSQMADLMLARFNKVIMPYWRKNRRKMAVKMSLHEILTLASIIEKEAQVESERPMISSVYHNRLRIRMHLGADPTIKYVLERPGKIVSYDDLKINSPYNTYRHYGLPPGPICNPGLSSVKAAMFPEKSDYLYFVARADGSHIFTKSLAEHEAAQQQTRRERIRKIYRKE